MTNRKLISCAAVLLGLVLTAPGLWAQDYQEAPALAAMVEAGTLPPVQERLPAEPLVIEPVEEIGQYGGTWEKLISSAGQTALMTIYAYDRLLRWNPDATAIEPNIATSYEVTDGGKTFVFHLREGMKWSDGHPFTADDFVFWYEDMLLNEELTPSFPTWLMAGGEPVVIEKIDDYTVRFRFAAPYGLLPEYLSYFNLPFRPKHYLQQFHPAYADQDDLDKLIKEEGVEHWYQLFQNKDQWYRKFNPDLPVVEPWVVITPQPATRVVLERNPYYWKTDPAGNQLPYIDEVAVSITTTVETLNLKTMSGEFDFQMRYLNPANFTLFYDNQEREDYRILEWPTGIGSDAALFFNQSTPDLVLRELFQDLRFRQALSLAIDREEINQLVFDGQGQPRQATVVALSPLFKPEYAAAYADHDPDRANQLLDAIGLTERDGDGFRLRPDGETLSLLLDSPGEKTATIDSIELVIEYWGDIGIKAAANHTERSAYRARRNANETQINVWEMGFMMYPSNPLFLIASSSGSDFGPDLGVWYNTGGAEGQEPPEAMKEALRAYDQIKQTPDTEQKNELFHRILELQAENIWVLGLVGGVKETLIVKNHMRNVPDESIFDSLVGRYIGLTAAEQYFIRQ
jgi:peptide/nickel transport system substrate-binding protein